MSFVVSLFFAILVLRSEIPSNQLTPAELQKYVTLNIGWNVMSNKVKHNYM